MSAQPVKNVSASVKNRILSMARQSRKPFQSLLTHYGLERFLFRVSRSPLKEKFVLKGGLLLMGMGLPMARTTRDIDFLGLGSNYCWILPSNSSAMLEFSSRMMLSSERPKLKRLMLHTRQSSDRRSQISDGYWI